MKSILNSKIDFIYQTAIPPIKEQLSHCLVNYLYTSCPNSLPHLTIHSITLLSSLSIIGVLSIYAIQSLKSAYLKHTDINTLEASSSPQNIEQPKLPSVHKAILENDTLALKKLMIKGYDPNEQNNFGNTPLHYALLTQHDSRTAIKILLANNANPDAQNMRGETPGMISKASRSHKMGKKYVTGPFKELFYRQILAHLYDINEEFSSLAPYKPVQLTGFYPRYFSHLLTKVLTTQFKGQNTVELLKDTLLFNSTIRNCSPKSIYSRLQSKKPVLLEIGPNKHTIMLLIYPKNNNYRLGIANRGALSKKPIEFWTAPSADISLKFVQRILKIKELSQNEYVEQIESEVWSFVKREKTPADTKLEKLCGLPTQKALNCAWVSSITAVWAFLALQYEGTQDCKESTDHMYQEIYWATLEYVSMKYFDRQGELQKYPQDQVLVTTITSFLQSRCSD